MDQYHAQWQVPELLKIEQNPKSGPATLRTKLLEVRKHLLGRGVMSKQELQYVRYAADSGKKDQHKTTTLLAASVVTLNEYVHNRFFHPDPDSVRAGWKSLAPFIHQICEDGCTGPAK